MEALFLQILELSLYGSLLILAVLPLRMLLQKAPKWVTCLLWAMVAFALVCPLRLESPASVMPTEAAITQIIPMSPPALPSVQTEPVTIPTLPVENDVHIITHTEPDYTAIGAKVWVCGMGLLALYAAATVLRLRKRVAASLHICDNIYLCDDIDTPFILGVLRPRIYLPSAIDEATAEQVLLHERAHLRRRDHWWKPMGFLLLTVHWFNPLVWAAYMLLCRDIELACDEKVVRDMAAADKKQYTEALLTCSVPRHLIAACPLAFGEVGVKQRIKAVLHYKKPAFWVIVIAIVVCMALCIGFLTKPAVTTLEELGDVHAFEIESVRIDSSASYHIYDSDKLFETLAQLQVRPALLRSDIGGASHLITMQRRENAAIYTLHFSPDCTKLQIIRTVQGPGDDYEIYKSHYRVLNPEILTESDKSTVTTDYLQMDKVPKFALDPNMVNSLSAHVSLDNRYGFEDSDTITKLCALLNSLEFTGDRSLSFSNGYMNLQLQMTDDSVLQVVFNEGYTLCEIIVYRTIDGVQQGVLFTDDYVIGNPELVQSSEFVRTVTEVLPNSKPIPISEALTAVENSLNSGALNWDTVTLPDSILTANELLCSVTYPYWVNDKGEIPNNTSMFFSLTYTDDGFVLDYPEGLGIDSLILADTPFNVTLTPAGSRESTVISIRIDPATGEILSAASRPVEQPDHTPTADQLQTAIEEHLRNKNRYFKNLKLLGDAFFDPDSNMYYLLITLDQTRSDGTELSRNNLLLVSVLDTGSYLRVDGMVSGTPARSAGIYPNIAEMNGQLVLWTTRNVNHMKLTEDGAAVEANLSVPNDITKCSITCENGNTHTWALTAQGGVFLLPKGDIPISVTPLDKDSNPLKPLTFGKEYLDPTKVRTVSEESGWNAFLNIDSSDLCGYPTVQSIPLYLDMDSSFQNNMALYDAMKNCSELPALSWSTVKLAGTVSCEGYEYAAVSYTEVREPMALLIEYQTNEDGTVTLLQYAKGYVPDKQGFLTGYYMNHSSMSCGGVYWSLFDTRYATSKNGKEADSTKTTEPKFTDFRFTMRDLKTHDFPVEGDFFFAKFSPVIPPAIVTPKEGKTLLAALGSEPMSGLSGTITLP